MIKSIIHRACLLVSVVFVSGCASLANSPQSVLSTASSNLQEEPYALPADYELPPYIRIVSLPLVSDTPSVSENAVLLGDYWLFASEGYTVRVVAVPTARAGASYRQHAQLNTADTQLIRQDSESILLVTGHYRTHEDARTALKSINQPGAQVIALRDLKALRCQSPGSETLTALCAGTPVKTLRIAEVAS